MRSRSFRYPTNMCGPREISSPWAPRGTSLPASSMTLTSMPAKGTPDQAPFHSAHFSGGTNTCGQLSVEP